MAKPYSVLILFSLTFLSLVSVMTKNVIKVDTVGVMIFLFVIYTLLFTPKSTRSVFIQAKNWWLILVSFLTLSIVPVLLHHSFDSHALQFLNIYASSISTAAVLSYLLMRYNIGKDFFWYLILSASLIILYILLKEISIVGLQEALSGKHRFGEIASTGCIDFGWYSSVIFVVLLGIFPWAKQKGILIFLTSILALLIAFMGAILSHSRTAWIGWPEAFLIWGAYYLYQYKTQHKSLKLSLFMVAFFTIFYILWQQPAIGGEIKKRSYLAYQNIIQYTEHNNPMTSLGQRFVMYEMATKQLIKTPILGIGPDAFPEFMEKESNKLLSSKFGMDTSFHYSQIHNQFLMTSLMGGLIALGGLILLLAWAFYYFFHHFQQKSDKEIWLTGGVFMVVSTMAFMPESPFHFHKEMLFYFIVLSLIVAVTSNISNREESTSSP